MAGRPDVEGQQDRSVSGHHEFRCCTTAAPAVVWSALTDPAQTVYYLYGLAATSSWEADTPILFDHPEFPLAGQVVLADPPRRLSYLLHAGGDHPAVYLTWEIRPSPSGATIRLSVDEPGLAVEDTEAEDIWLPVLAALQALLGSDQIGPVGPDGE